VRNVSAESALAKAHKYLANDIATPFFIVVDDSIKYSEIITGLSSLTRIHVSDYCANNDAYPNIDELYGALSTTNENTLLLGFGESVSLGGNENAVGRLKDLNIEAKVVVLCRGIRAAVKFLCEEDKKFNSRRVCFLKSGPSYEIVKLPPLPGVSAIDGFKELLFCLENGGSGKLSIKTTLKLNNSRELYTAYEVIQEVDPTYIVLQNCLPDNLYAEFLADRNLDGFDLFHWRSFLKLKLESSANVYLKYVADTSANYDAYKKTDFLCIIGLFPKQ